MADDIKVISQVDKETAEAYLETLKEVTDEIKNATLQEKARALAAKDYFESLQNSGNIQSKITELNDKSRELTTKINEAQSAGNENLVGIRKRQQEILKEQIKNLEAAERLKQTQHAINAASAGTLKLSELKLKASERILVVEQKLKNLRLDSTPDEEGDNKEFLTKMGEAALGLGASLGTLGKKLTDLNLETIAFSTLMPGLGLGVEQFGEALVGFAAKTDDSFRTIMKGGVSFSQGIYQIYTAALDPILSANDEFGFISNEFQDEMMTMTNLTGEDMAKAALVAKNNISIFRRELIDSSKESRGNAAATLNLMANINKLGVAHEDTAKAIDFFTRGLKQTPEMARESVRSLTNIAHTLDLNVATVFKEFSGTMGDLAQFGHRQIQVFADLQAQYRATGVEVDTLSKMAAKLDTFKGAAQAAQGLNAVLGDTVVSVTDLVHADPAEKINLLRQAFDRSGISFSDADRRIKSIVANLLGIDTAAATKLFGSEEDFFTIQNQMDTSAEDIDQLKGRIEETLKVSEQATKAQQMLATASTKILDRAYRTADRTTAAMAEVFEASVRGSKDAEAGLLGLIGTVKGLQRVATTTKGVAQKALGFAAGAVVLEQLLEVLGFAPAPVKNKMLDIIETAFQEDIGRENDFFNPDGQIGLAEGGIVKAQPGGVSATLAEAGEDEAVIPLSKLAGMLGLNNSPDGPVQLVLQDVTLKVDGFGEGTINQVVEASLNGMVTGKPQPKLIG